MASYHIPWIIRSFSSEYYSGTKVFCSFSCFRNIDFLDDKIYHPFCTFIFILLIWRLWQKLPILMRTHTWSSLNDVSLVEQLFNCLNCDIYFIVTLEDSRKTFRIDTYLEKYQD